MVTAATQKRNMKAERKAAAAAAAKVQELAEKEAAKARRAASPCTAEQIVEERDVKGLSWRQVAINLDLGSPGQARKTYTKLTGKPHNESQPVARRAKSGSGTARRKSLNPQWDDESDQDEIEKRLAGAVITVSRRIGNSAHTFEEEVKVRRVTSFTFGKNGDLPLTVDCVEYHSGATRSFRVAEIVEVR